MVVGHPFRRQHAGRTLPIPGPGDPPTRLDPGALLSSRPAPALQLVPGRNSQTLRALVEGGVLGRVRLDRTRTSFDFSLADGASGGLPRRQCDLVPAPGIDAQLHGVPSMALLHLAGRVSRRFVAGLSCPLYRSRQEGGCPSVLLVRGRPDVDPGGLPSHLDGPGSPGGDPRDASFEKTGVGALGGRAPAGRQLGLPQELHTSGELQRQLLGGHEPGQALAPLPRRKGPAPCRGSPPTRLAPPAVQGARRAPSLRLLPRRRVRPSGAGRSLQVERRAEFQPPRLRPALTGVATWRSLPHPALSRPLSPESSHVLPPLHPARSQLGSLSRGL